MSHTTADPATAVSLGLGDAHRLWFGIPDEHRAALPCRPRAGGLHRLDSRRRQPSDRDGPGRRHVGRAAVPQPGRRGRPDDRRPGDRRRRRALRAWAGSTRPGTAGGRISHDGSTTDMAAFQVVDPGLRRRGGPPGQRPVDPVRGVQQGRHDRLRRPRPDAGREPDGTLERLYPIVDIFLLVAPRGHAPGPPAPRPAGPSPRAAGHSWPVPTDGDDRLSWLPGPDRPGHPPAPRARRDGGAVAGPGPHRRGPGRAHLGGPTPDRRGTAAGRLVALGPAGGLVAGRRRGPRRAGRPARLADDDRHPPAIAGAADTRMPPTSSSRPRSGSSSGSAPSPSAGRTGCGAGRGQPRARASGWRSCGRSAAAASAPSRRRARGSNSASRSRASCTTWSPTTSASSGSRQRPQGGPSAGRPRRPPPP